MPLLSEPPLRLEPRADRGVELGDITPAMGENQAALRFASLLHRRGVIAHESRACAAAARCPPDPLVLDIRPQGGRRLPSPEGLRGLPLPTRAAAASRIRSRSRQPSRARR